MPCSDLSPIRRERPWPFGLMGMVVLIVVAEVGLSRLDSRLTPLGASNWRQTGVVASTDLTHADVLLFGDSLVKTGLLPAVFEQEHGLTSFNLALLGAPPSASYFLLRRALDAGAKPRAIVLDAQPSILMLNGPTINPREWAELLEPREALKLTKIEHDPNVLTLYLLNRYVPSIRYRFDVQKSIVDLFNSPVAPTGVTWLALHDRQLERNRGSYVNPSTPGRFGPDPRPGGKVSDEERSSCYPGAWWGRRANLAFVERFLLLAESRQIPVFFLLPPIHPGVQAKRERLGLEETYLAVIRKIQKRFPSVVVVDGRHAGFDHGLFWDAFHLGREGAVALSRSVASVIAARIDGGSVDSDRWVSLPAFADAPRRIAIEDIDESRVRLREFDAVRR